MLLGVKPIKDISVKHPCRLQFIVERLVNLFEDRIKAREVISEAFLQVTRIKPDDPIDFLHN